MVPRIAALTLLALWLPVKSCWTKNGVMVCKSNEDCEENAKCHEGFRCRCLTEQGICSCASDAEDGKEERLSEVPGEPDGVARAFQVADKDRDGLISRKEAYDSLADSLSEEERQDMFRGLDADGDGFVSREELAAALSGEEEDPEDDAEL
eukprot:TRINITY_DN101855_c0_g1_i1.p2 TRINITY_DN101855_c0_g1~~TRINITY_DN101855_c0_g1_i1.p2  ORF type:complete len:151 (+),score=45.94 TRINITY_DN101855_c0_g1_i1:95-547(+)